MGRAYIQSEMAPKVVVIELVLGKLLLAIFEAQETLCHSYHIKVSCIIHKLTRILVSRTNCPVATDLNEQLR